jgi:hypothetical protein
MDSKFERMIKSGLKVDVVVKNKSKKSKKRKMKVWPDDFVGTSRSGNRLEIILVMKEIEIGNDDEYWCNKDW